MQERFAIGIGNAWCGWRLFRCDQIAPVRLTVLAGCEIELQTTERDRADFDLSAKQWHELHADGKAIDACEWILAKARRISEADVACRDAEPREEHELEVVFDDELTSRAALDPLRDIVLIVVRVERDPNNDSRNRG